MAGQCPLVHAARSGCLQVAGYLLSCDWVVNNCSEVSLGEAVQQALIAAAAQGHNEVDKKSRSHKLYFQYYYL